MLNLEMGWQEGKTLTLRTGDSNSSSAIEVNWVWQIESWMAHFKDVFRLGKALYGEV